MRRELLVSIALIGSVPAAWAGDVEDLLPELAKPDDHKARFAFSTDEVSLGGSAGRPFEGGGLRLDKLVVGRAGDGTSAWLAADAINKILRGECAPEPCSGAETTFHAAGLAERAGDAWRWVAWHITRPVTAKEQADLVKRGIIPDVLPRSIAGAEAAVQVFEASIGDPKALAATVSDRKEVVLYGSEPRERAEGGAQVKARLLAWNLAFKVRDGLQAGVTASKTVAWIAANVDAVSAKRPKDAPQPYRLLAIYEKTAAAWKLVQLSFSVDPFTPVKKK